MKMALKTIVLISAIVLFILPSCKNVNEDDGSEKTAKMTKTFKSAYKDILNLDPAAVTKDNFHDYAEEVDSALLVYDLLNPDAKKALAKEKAKLDALAAKINDLREAEYIFYVAPNGNDANDGRKDTPFATLAKAEEKVSPGSIVYIRGGTYNVKEADIMRSNADDSYLGSVRAAYVFNITKSGTPTKPIKYMAYPGDSERPVFNLSNVKPTNQRVYVFFVGGNYRHFKGFDVVGTQVTITTSTQSEGFHNEGSNNIYENLAVHDGMAIGFYLRNGSNNLFLNCDAYNNSDSVSNPGGTPGGNTDGFGGHPTSAGNTGNVFRGCRAWLNSDDGYDLIGSLAPVVIDNCWTFLNGYAADASGSVTGPGGIKLKNMGDGAGFKSGGYGMQGSTYPLPPEGNAPRHTVQFSLAFYNRQQGFYANHHLGGINWYNNTGYQNPSNFNMANRKSSDRDSSVYCHDVLGYGHEMINNLSFAPRNSGQDVRNTEPGNRTSNYDNAPDPETDGTNNILNNSFSMGIKVTEADFVDVTDWEQLKRPRKADGSLPDITFLKPAAGGQLVDKGKVIRSEFVYKGAAPDLGCMEN